MSKGRKPRALRIRDAVRPAAIKRSAFAGTYVSLPSILDDPSSMRRLADWLHRAAEWLEAGEGR